uniref:Putative kinesin n=1 Tax=Trypanosoma congolense (strain IL3000) TaxID=1068625 RepID=G0UQ59_TRYCI|nr:putative kinesin [Trypanosoma congolense IL3000]
MDGGIPQLCTTKLIGNSAESVLVTVRVRPLQNLKNETNNSVKRQDQREAALHVEEGPVVRLGIDDGTLVLLDPQKLLSIRANFAFHYVFYPSFLDNEFLTVGSVAGGKPQCQSGKRHIDDILFGNCSSGVPDNDTKGDNLSAVEAQEELEQQKVFDVIGTPLVECFKHGRNSCLLAYGQTGSGRSYTLYGTAQHPGVIPRVCRELLGRSSPSGEGSSKTPFGRLKNPEGMRIGGALCPAIPSGFALPDVRSPVPISPKSSIPTKPPSPRLFASSRIEKRDSKPTELTISYMEVCNEWVRDLLKPRKEHGLQSVDTNTSGDKLGGVEKLKVRYYPNRGPCIEGLTSLKIRSWEECKVFIEQGNAERARLSYKQKNSSYTHTIFRITRGSTPAYDPRCMPVQNLPKVDIVELSSMNCLKSSGTSTMTMDAGGFDSCRRQLKEFNAVQRSLGVLSRVLQALVNNSKYVPYRENLLTNLLSDNFFAPSRVVLCATVLSEAGAYVETLSTLRYAAQLCSDVSCRKGNEISAGSTLSDNKQQTATPCGKAPLKIGAPLQSTRFEDTGKPASESPSSVTERNNLQVSDSGVLNDTNRMRMGIGEVSSGVEGLPRASSPKMALAEDGLCETVKVDAEAPPGIAGRGPLWIGGYRHVDWQLRKMGPVGGLPPLTGNAGVNSLPNTTTLSFDGPGTSRRSSPFFGSGGATRGDHVRWDAETSPQAVKERPIPTSSRPESPGALPCYSSPALEPGDDPPCRGPSNPTARICRAGGLPASLFSCRTAEFISYDGVDGTGCSVSRVSPVSSPECHVSGHPNSSPFPLQTLFHSPDHITRKESRRNLVKVFTPEELPPSQQTSQTCSLKHNVSPTPILSRKASSLFKTLSGSGIVSPSKW